MENNTNKTNTAKDKYTNRIFYFGLEVLGYFAVPAVLGVLIGKYLERNHDLNITIPILFGTYVLSWIIFVLRYRSLRKNRPVEKNLADTQTSSE